MLNMFEKILKYNPGEKSLKVPFVTHADLERFLEKQTHVKMILKNLSQKKKLSIHLLVTHGLHAVYSINHKTNGVITEEKTV